MSEHKPLLDILVEHATPETEPPAGLTWGFRAVHPDLRSRDGYRYPWPGGWAVAPDDGRPLVKDGEPCPSSVRGGLCVAKTACGAAQGGIRLSTVLLVAYHPDHVLGEDAMKVRVSRMWVADVLDVGGLARAGHLGGSDLRWSDLRWSDLGGSDLRWSNLGGSDLRWSNLCGSDLRWSDLRWSDLRGAHADSGTRWPDGFDAKAAGVVT